MRAIGFILFLTLIGAMLTTQHQDAGYASLPTMKVGMEPVVTPAQAMVDRAVAAIVGALPTAAPAPLAGTTTPIAPPTGQAVAGDVGDMSIKRAPSISAAQIDAVLASYNSPAMGSGQRVYDLGVQYGIDPAYALAFFIHESSAGTAGAAATTRNWGNIICAGYPTCDGRWRTYPTWEAGAEDWYKLIDTEYVTGRGMTTIDQVVPVFAPSAENDVGGYQSSIAAMVAGWREANAPPAASVASGATTILATMPAPSARFNDWNCTYWDWQKNGSDCRHYGTDYPAPVGTPVRVPQDCLFLSKADTSYWGGGFFRCSLPDGAILYLGHLQNLQTYLLGQVIPAGTTIGEVYPHPNGSHVHVQLTVNNKLVDWEAR